MSAPSHSNLSSSASSPQALGQGVSRAHGTYVLGGGAAQLQARVAARLAGALSVQHASLPADISERLRISREQAVARARQVRVAVAAKAGSASVALGRQAGGAVLLGQSMPWWQRMASALPLVALVAGLVMIDQRGQHEQVQAAALIDAQLLSDDLPPSAYSDPGFAEFLRSTAYSPISSVNAQVGE